MDKELLKALNDLLDEKLKPITDKLDEHTQILRALEHASECNKAELDNLNHQFSRIEEEEVKSIRDDLNTVELITSKNWNDIVKLKAVK